MWSDDTHILYKWDLDIPEIELQNPGLKVVNFYPMHIYLNMGQVMSILEKKEILVPRFRNSTKGYWVRWKEAAE